MTSYEIILAPMEGVLDHLMRRLLTEINRYDYCISEFVRVSGSVLPKKSFLSLVPELTNGGKTASGTPVWVQLLGSEPDLMAKSALVAVRLGALGIDLNFGCPSRFVNRSHGGAYVLKDPTLVGDVAKAVRDAVPPEIPVSAKIRLGWDSPDEAPTIMENLYRSGVDKIAIHARTRNDVYAPGTIKWELVKSLKEKSPVPVIINGDITSQETAKLACEASGCKDMMIGRFAVAIPNIERVLRNGDSPYTFNEILLLALRYMDILAEILPEHYQKTRLKQYFGYIRKAYPEIQEFFMKLCHLEDIEEMRRFIVVRI